MRQTFDISPALVVLAPPDSLSDITSLTVSGEKPKGTRKVDKVRAVVIEDQFLIGKDSQYDINVIFRERIEDIQKTKAGWHIKTRTGKIIAVAKDEKCACGTRLKSWNPYGSYIPSTQDAE